MDLIRKPTLLQGFRQIRDLGGSEGVEVLLARLKGGRILRGFEGERSPVGAVEDGGWGDVEEDDGVSGADVVVHGPADGEGAFVG